jgi:hypothetical protein
VSTTSASRWRVLYHLARADFLERLRRYSFLLTMGFALYFGYLAAVGRITLRLGDIRGVYNSAWIGALMALVVATFLSLAGFYVVKNTIERDRQTRVGQILASTPMSKVLYVGGKWLSNYAVLAVVIAILAVCGIVMQLWLGEDRHIELWKLLAPSLLLALPAMAVVAALAVLFETISWLRGGFGNVVYFFVWTALLVMGIGSKGLSYDLAGLSLVMNSMLAASNTTEKSFSFSLDVGPHGPAHSAFVWNGIDWTAPIVLSRILWVGVAVLVTLAAAVFFDRFDAARGKAPAGTAEPVPTGPVAAEAVVTAARVQVAALTSLPRTPAQFRFGAMLAAELRLMLTGQKWWWYAVAAGLLIACAAVPSADARGILLGCAWIWPVLLWSQMGVRELRDQTNQLLFSTPHPIARQLPAVWLSGVILALLTGSGFAVRLIVGGNVKGLLAWAIGALFIPTLALSLGVWSGNSKPFEIIYTLLWYVGPMHAMPPLDFMGSAPATAATRYPSVYLLLACGLGVATLAGRKRQLLT